MSIRKTNFEENKYPSQHSSMEQQTPIVLYLNEKVKLLEAENNELKKEINLKSNKIEYYLRLRKEMLEQIESLKSENVSKEVYFRNEVDKLNETVNKMNEQLNEKKGLKEDYVNNTSPLKYFEKENKSMNEVNKKISDNNKSRLNKTTIKNSSDKKVKTKYFQNVISDNNDVFSFDEFKVTQNIKTQELLLQQNENCNQKSINDEEKTNSNSAYVTIIGDLEERLNDLNKVLKLRDEEISNLKNELSNMKSNSTDTKEALQKEIESWKQKYLILFNNKKILSEEFSDFHSKKEENNKKESDKNLYGYQKKVLHLESLCLKYENDIETLSQQHINNENQRQLEIENLKFNVKKMVDNYDQINKTYEENLKALVIQIDNIKTLYINREGEFMELTDYYCKAIEEYSKPLQILGKKERIFELEELNSKQLKEIESLKKELDKHIKENTKLKNEIIEAKPAIRAKISEAMNGYETALKEANDTHESLKSKLNCLEKFVTYFDEQFKFFNSLLDEKKKLQEHTLNLECEIKMMNIHAKEEEILLLKEKNINLVRDIEIKANLIKEYEKIISASNNSTISDKKKVKEVSGDILMKLNTEISILTNQVVGLNKTKESIENFYKTELKNSVDKIKEKSDKIEDLQNVINKLQHDFTAKKETIFSLWCQEFKEFKENLVTMTDIKNIIQKFNIDGEELKINCDRVASEEHLMLRDEMKIKDNLILELKKNNEDEKKNLSALIESYKTTINLKQNSYDNLIYQKHMELQSLCNEKQALIQLEKKKQELCQKEQKSWTEQKELLNNLVITQFESKDKEISLLKNHVEILQKELNNTKENYQKDIDNVLKSVETQLGLIKDRELFTVSQLTELEDRYKNLRQEKDRITHLLKEENEDLKNQNRVLSKLKLESSNIQSKSTLYESKK